MRTANNSAIQYAPEDPPADPKELQRYLRGEMAKLSAVVAALAAGHLDKTHVAPAKPREGDLRLADGVDWNPGSGKGLYIHDGTAWVLVIAL